MVVWGEGWGAIVAHLRPATGRRVYRLVPGASFVITIVIIRPVVVHLIFLREELCKGGSSFARLGHLLPLFALPVFAHEKPAARVGAVLNDLGELGGGGRRCA